MKVDDRDACPEVERHTSVPSGYVARAEDAERRLAAGEIQRQCTACGLWVIWDRPGAEKLSEATVEELEAEIRRRRTQQALDFRWEQEEDAHLTLGGTPTPEEKK